MIHPPLPMSLLVRDALLDPALDLLPDLDHRDDLAFSDAEFLTLGVRRINTLQVSLCHWQSM